MNINDLYPSKYLSASDLQGREAEVTISNVAMEEVGKDKEMRPILYFQGKQKGVVLNKTNAHNVGAIYGPDTNGWLGQRVTLFVVWTDFNGKSVEAIRIRGPRPAGAAAEPAPAAVPAADSRPAYAEEFDDAVPF
tara:strand:+ start:43306 stop:43710 length:405 start_codon:yes stop_codon:yes gene_type:complete